MELRGERQTSSDPELEPTPQCPPHITKIPGCPAQWFSGFAQGCESERGTSPYAVNSLSEAVPVEPGSLTTHPLHCQVPETVLQSHTIIVFISGERKLWFGEVKRDPLKAI